MKTNLQIMFISVEKQMQSWAWQYVEFLQVKKKETGKARSMQGTAVSGRFLGTKL
jgi:hypothetical protein